MSTVSERPFMRHARDQVTWRLLANAKKALAEVDLAEVLLIAATQYGFNVSALGVYYDLHKTATYDTVKALAKIALDSRVPELERALKCVSAIEKLSKFYTDLLSDRVFLIAEIKK